jgi:hypothetical protein
MTNKLHPDVVGKIVRINNGYLVEVCDEVEYVKTPSEVGNAFSSLLAKIKLTTTGERYVPQQLDLFTNATGVVTNG